MPRKWRIAAIALAALATVVAAALGGAYAALQRVRPFYEQALAIEPQTLEAGSRELESRATALYNDARRAGQWQAAFTAEQINGWLATQLDNLYDDALSDGISDPRVAIDDGKVTLGFRARRGGVDTVISADAAVSLTESGAVAIRLLAVRAGALPLPSMQVADDLSKACQEMSLPIRWTQEAGQPVALIDVDRDLSSNDRRIVIDTAELRDGTLFVAGHTETGELAQD
jgi:hypothetical protein